MSQSKPSVVLLDVQSLQLCCGKYFEHPEIGPLFPTVVYSPLQFFVVGTRANLPSHEP